MNVVIVNYEMGNLGSLRNMLRKLGHEATLSSEAAVIEKASHLILPGVGHFAKGMENLRRLGLVEVLEDRVLRHGTPTLGICLGMQLLARRSEEGDCPGLGWIDAEVIRFRPAVQADGRPLRVPHMGWNFLRSRRDDPLFAGLTEQARFYFVHTFHFHGTADSQWLASSEYGIPFTAAVKRDRLYGVQFHPEKSHRFGMGLIRNFLELSP